MFFMNKKRFEEEMHKRMNQAHFTESTERRLYELEEKVRNLQWKVDNIEQREEYRTPAPTPIVPTTPYAPISPEPPWWAQGPMCTCKADEAAEVGSNS